MARNAAHDQERELYATFATKDADDKYRGLLEPLYKRCREWNIEYFDSKLLVPHLGIGPTHPRTVGSCEPTTQYGASVQNTLNAGLAFGTNTRWVRNPWPAVGLRLLMEDLLLRFTVRQFVLEVREAEERGYDGFGQLFATEANRIGMQLGLAQVAARNRMGESNPLAKFWPHNVWLAKDPRRYGIDVTQELLDLVAGTSDAPHRAEAPPSLFLLCDFILAARRRPG